MATGLTKKKLYRTVGSLREALKDYDDEFELMFGESIVDDANMAVAIDEDFGMVLIDTEEHIDKVINGDTSMYDNKIKQENMSPENVSIFSILQNYYDYDELSYDDAILTIKDKNGRETVYDGKFTDVRVSKASLPNDKELHVYEIASDDDDGFDPVRISKFVLVNFFGSIIFEQPVPLDKMGKLWIDGTDVKLEIG